MRRPYLCVSALQSVHDAAAALQFFSEYRLLKHVPCLGFALDERSLQKGSVPSPRKVDSLQVVEEVAQIIVAQDVELALHVDLRSRDGSTPDGNTIPDLSKFFLKPQGLIAAIISSLKSSSALLQLNGVVSASDLSEVKVLQPASRIILPIGEAHLALSDETLGDYLSSVSSLVDYFLFDCSGGLGKAFSLEAFKRFAQAARTYAPNCALGFSGGLSPVNIQTYLDQMRSDAKLQQLAPIEALSIDVESGIRSIAPDGQDRVDYSKLSAFIENAIRALS